MFFPTLRNLNQKDLVGDLPESITKPPMMTEHSGIHRMSQFKSLSRSFSYMFHWNKILQAFAWKVFRWKVSPLNNFLAVERDTLQDTLGRVSKRRRESSRKAKGERGWSKVWEL